MADINVLYWVLAILAVILTIVWAIEGPRHNAYREAELEDRLHDPEADDKITH